LNEDLAGEYQAIIAYTVYSQVLKGAAYTDIARELELHAGKNWRTPSRSPSRLIIWAGCRA
jgi:bacterioferritin (cytochrome b1)